jgi:hypothetical protein
MAESVIDKAGASPAPASETPKSSASITSGTASEALIRAASSAETTASAPPAGLKAGDTPPKVEGQASPETTPAATVPPKVEGSTEKPAVTGEAPEARIQAATRNARTNLLTQIGRDLGLTDTVGKPRAITPQDVGDMRLGLNLLRDLQADSGRFFQALARQLGYELPEERGAEDYALPKASLRSEDGQEAYSASDMAKVVDIIERKLTARFEGQLKPLADDHRTRAEQSVVEQIQRESKVVAGSALSEARQYPHFKENEAAIAARIAELREADPNIHKRIGAIGLMYKAYNDVMATKVFPSIDSEAERRVREDNARKAAGSSLVHPSGSGNDAKKVEIANVDQLADRMRRMAAGEIPVNVG